ncbi:hypothetical protein EJP39_22815 [Escherichia coli]|nr:hypothetical protein [Escherichia coli]
MKAYWDSLTKEQQGELAGKVGSTPGYLRLVFNGYKKASFVLAKKLEQCTSGAITKSDLRPDTRQQDELNSLDELRTLAIDVDYLDPGNGPDGDIEHHTEITLPS